jgi:hypothetical protein
MQCWTQFLNMWLKYRMILEKKFSGLFYFFVIDG